MSRNQGNRRNQLNPIQERFPGAVSLGHWLLPARLRKVFHSVAHQRAGVASAPGCKDMVDRPRFTNEQVDQALEILRNATKSHPVTSEELGHRLHLNDIEGNWKARELITEVIRTRGLPVGANGTGYYVIRDMRELKEYRDDLQRRAISILERIALVERAFREANGETEVPETSMEDEW